MKRRSIKHLVVPLVVAAALVAPQLLHASPRLTKIRHAMDDERTRVVIDLSQKVDYKVYDVDNPSRIAINLPNVVASKSLMTSNFSSGVVRRIRINRLSWGAQVVLDLRREAAFSDFRLAPVDGMPNRIVIDVEGGDPATVVATRSVKPTTRRSSTKASAKGKSDSRPIMIAVDAGHGGSDPGALGKGGYKEKTMTLDMARRVVKRLNAKPGYRAFLTRDRDVFLSLRTRAEIARQKGAHAFVSIHMNTAPKRSARGSEVFFLAPRGAEATAAKLLRNRSKAAEELGLSRPSSDDILHMLVDVNQQSMMQKSSAFAEEILDALDQKGLPPTRKVKQRSFAVLKSISMPSVLVEAGFLTNSRDLKILVSESGKNAIADAVTDGVVTFMQKYPPPVNETGRLIVHRVKRGDTLWGISRRYHTSVSSIQQTNKLGGSKRINVGQELVIREGYETF